MSANTGDGMVYIALVLATLAAVLSAPSDSATTYRKLGWLLTTDTTPDTVISADAIGGTSDFPVSP
jgi:hypothetical protein